MTCFFFQVAVAYTTAGEYDLSSEWGQVVNAIIHFALITRGSFNVRLAYCRDSIIRSCCMYFKTDQLLIDVFVFSLKSVHITNEITEFSQVKRTLYGHYKNEVIQ